MKKLTVEELLVWIEDIRDQFNREMKQGVLREEMRVAHDALIGEQACERIVRMLKSRAGMYENMHTIHKIEFEHRRAGRKK